MVEEKTACSVPQLGQLTPQFEADHSPSRGVSTSRSSSSSSAGAFGGLPRVAEGGRHCCCRRVGCRRAQQSCGSGADRPLRLGVASSKEALTALRALCRALSDCGLIRLWLVSAGGLQVQGRWLATLLSRDIEAAGHRVDQAA